MINYIAKNTKKFVWNCIVHILPNISPSTYGNFQILKAVTWRVGIDPILGSGFPDPCVLYAKY